MSRNVTTRKSVRLGLGLVGAGLAAALLLAPVSGAVFTASETGTVNASTAKLTLEVNGPGNFALNFPNIAPGKTVTQNLEVTNTGTVAANVTLGQPATAALLSGGGALTPAELPQLKVAIPGYVSSTPAATLPTQLNLGTLGAGQTRVYSIQVSLDSAAGNNWQNVVVGGTATVTLTQS